MTRKMPHASNPTTARLRPLRRVEFRNPSPANEVIVLFQTAPNLLSNAPVKLNPAIKSKAPAPKKAPEAELLSPLPRRISNSTALSVATPAIHKATFPFERRFVVKNCHCTFPARSSRAGRATCLRSVSQMANSETKIAANAPMRTVDILA